MTDRYMAQSKKSPISGAILSAICPGAGFFYAGDALKAVAYMVIFACLIVLQVKVRSGGEHAMVGLMQGGFYLFQIFDTYQTLRRMNKQADYMTGQTEMHASLPASIMILSIGILFQLAQLDIICFSDILNLWPVALIVIGAYHIFSFFRENQKKEEEGGQNE